MGIHSFASVKPSSRSFILRSDATITNILLYHVVPGTALSTDLTEGVLPTVQGEIVEVTLDPIAINGAGVAIPDVLATNGVVHVIDAVLIPPEGL